MGAYHLAENLGNSRWKINGKVTFQKFQPKVKECVLRSSLHSGSQYKPNGMLLFSVPFHFQTAATQICPFFGIKPYTDVEILC